MARFCNTSHKELSFRDEVNLDYPVCENCGNPMFAGDKIYIVGDYSHLFCSRKCLRRNQEVTK